MTVASVFPTARNMKHFRLLLITLCVLTLSCNRYDDSPIWSELQDLKDRIARLEALCKTMNSNISALEDIVAALQDNDYITDIYPLTENGVELGYKISFSKSGSITIYHGSDGPPGQDGADGTDGADGSDGHTPSIGVRKAEDGIYYWTLDGEWLLDADGNKIPTTGKDGADGEDGTDGTDGADGSDGTDGLPGAPGEPGKNGADGITPLLKIEENYWYISYDNGLTWEKLYKAVGENGVDGADGSDGIPGKDGTSFFQSVDISDPNYLTLILSDGTQIKIPTWKAFEELQASINRMNTNLTALQNIIEALQNKDYVTDIAVAIEGGQEVGYIIYFSKSQPVTIYHGKNGNDGSDGADGSDGSDGVDGSDGHTPVIGIRQGTDEDLSLDSGWIGDPEEDFYWTIDGEWLLDAEGNKIPANGQNGITPLLKIEDGRWYVSTDGGRSWKDEGPATGSDIESIFTEITYDNNYLYITLSDGERIILSRHQEKLGIACSAKPVEITDKTVRFSGYLDVPSDDLIYSSVTLYYSDIEPFSIYTAESVSTATFDYNRNFSISVTSLRPETTYTYCIYASGKYDELYGPVQSFTTLKEKDPADDEYFEKGTLIATVGDYSISGFVRPNGTIGASNGYYRTDYIDISSQDFVEIAVYSRPRSTSVSPIVFFDSQKNHISGLTPEIILDEMNPNDNGGNYEAIYRMTVPPKAHYVMSSSSLPSKSENLKMYGFTSQANDALGFKDSGAFIMSTSTTDPKCASANVLVPGGIYECTVTTDYTGKLSLYIGDSNYSGSGMVTMGSTSVNSGETTTFTFKVPHLYKTAYNQSYYPDKCYFRSFETYTVSISYSITKIGQDDNPLEGTIQFAHSTVSLPTQRVFGLESGETYTYSITTSYTGTLSLYESYSCARETTGSETSRLIKEISVTAGTPATGNITISDTVSTGEFTAGRLPDTIILRSHTEDEVTITYNFVKL